MTQRRHRWLARHPPFDPLAIIGETFPFAGHARMAIGGANRLRGHMRRREFIAFLGTSALLWTLPAKAHRGLVVSDARRLKTPDDENEASGRGDAQAPQVTVIQR